jgi:hypothetical protein
MRDVCVKSTKDLRKSPRKIEKFSTLRGAIRKRDKASANGRVEREGAQSLRAS